MKAPGGDCSGWDSGSPVASTPSGKTKKLRFAISKEVSFLLRVGMLIMGALSALQRLKGKDMATFTPGNPAKGTGWRRQRTAQGHLSQLLKSEAVLCLSSLWHPPRGEVLVIVNQTEKEPGGLSSRAYRGFQQDRGHQAETFKTSLWVCPFQLFLSITIKTHANCRRAKQPGATFHFFL